MFLLSGVIRYDKESVGTYRIGKKLYIVILIESIVFIIFVELVSL